MNRWLQLVTLLAIASVTFAADAPRPKTGTVLGSVSDAVKGTPLSGASITLKPLPGYNPHLSTDLLAATSDPEGKFAVNDVPPGKYLLIAKKNGFLDGTYGSKASWKSGIPISVDVGDVVKDVSVNLVPGAVISGIVENEDGEGFPNVSVRALQYRYQWPGKKLTVVSATTTNDHGEYRLHGLMPGSYYIVCSTRRDRVIKENGVSTVARYPVTFYPSVTTVETAATTSVKAGDEAVVKVVLTPAKVYSIHGKVAGADPDAKVALLVKPLLDTPEERQNIAVSDFGSFDVKGLLPGNYELMAIGAVRGRTASGKRRITIDDRDQNDVLITLDYERPAIRGSVVLPFGVERSKLAVNLVPGTSSDDEDGDDSTMVLGPVRPVGSPITDMYGQFTAAQLTRDAKTVFATIQPLSSGFEDFYVAAVRRNGEDVTNTGFNPARGGSLQIEYLRDSGRIEGTVASGDGQAISGATVIVIPDVPRRGRRDLYRMLRADQKGEFAIRGVAPGKYTILACDCDIENEAIYDADYMKPYLALSKAQSIEVTPRGKSFLVLGAIADTTDLGAP